MSRAKATLIGFAAILQWSLLALLTIGSAPVPPLLLNALCFGIGGSIGLVWALATGQAGQLRQVPWRVYAFGTLGLFGAHFLYFTAFRLAPAAETGLIAYLWPLLIVLLSGLLPGERILRAHLIGAALAFGGAALIVMQGGSVSGGALPGYAVAFGFALVWAGYSVLSRRFDAIPSVSVTVYCLAAAALSGIAHLALETTVWPQTALGWGAVAALGIGPVGISFFNWDVGMKQGDIQLLGVAAYAAPLLSTLVLVATGITPASATIGIAAVLIVGGAVVAARARRQDR